MKKALSWGGSFIIVGAFVTWVGLGSLGWMLTGVVLMVAGVGKIIEGFKTA